MKPRVLAAESEPARQLSELISRRRQLIEMRTAEKNRSARARGQALINIEAHLQYLEQADELLVVALTFVQCFIWVL
jgi:transposase